MGIFLNISYKSAFLLRLIQQTSGKGVYIPQGSKKMPYSWHVLGTDFGQTLVFQ